ncbi:ferrochelatase [Nakamurella endophytica]|uniref:Coproporphyrin III ferrochelatase n=1 Tax=Nakamurella endophytica TaxID=1748367 RepID=A0A917SIV5_9ACTN|nr:ferrochelatase [Nakamurella endophytica]GGL84648.1 ferrochelatase [Nakamurella endophytica]
MTARPAYDAVLLAGFGGPESPDDVMPFLRNVTRGRGVPEERLVEVSHHYLALGGVSPINEQNRALRVALEAELRRRGVDLPVLWGNRNWGPFLSDVVADAAGRGLTRLLGLATSAYSSYSGCRQYREDFGGALLAGGLVGTVVLDKVRPYYDRPGFLAPVADATVEAVRELLGDGVTAGEIEVVFTTHSIPTVMADSSGSAELGDHGSGGAYVAQHLAACRAVMDRLGRELGTTPSWQLAYQSRSGPPSVPWLEPDINDVITGLSGRRAVVAVPIGFISDHVEVVWDLDHEARDTAAAAGLRWVRVRTSGTDPRFVAALGDLVQARLDPAAGPVDAGAAGPVRPDFCPVGCCVGRVRRPTTAAQDSAVDWTDLDVTDDQLAASGIRGTRPRTATAPDVGTDGDRRPDPAGVAR